MYQGKLTKFAQALLVAFCGAPSLRSQVTLVGKVHPLVGTEKAGQTYPAVGLPFAMTSWTPQTRAGEVKCVAPYYYTDTKIQGFRGSHFMSGSCVPDYGSFTLMPLSGTLKTLPVERASTFERSSEHASPSGYRVSLRDAGVAAAITGASRAGLMKFRFLRAGMASVVIENNARAGDGWVCIDTTAQEVTGEVPVRREYLGKGKPAGFSGFFVMQFSAPIRAWGTWVGAETYMNATVQKGDGLAPGVLPSRPLDVAGKEDIRTGSPRPGAGRLYSSARCARGRLCW